MAAVVSAAALTGASSTLTAATAWAAQPGHSGSAWVINTVAGGVGGPARATRVALAGQIQQRVCGAGFGGGYLYVDDWNSVRKVNPQTGWLTTPAGTAVNVPLGDGGPATSAAVNGCGGVSVDHSGSLVLPDPADARVRVVARRTGTYYGRAMTAGDIYTVAGTGTRGFSGDGGPATKAELGSPGSTAVDGNGNLVIPDEGGERVRVVAARTGRFYQQSMLADHIYTVAGNGTLGFSGDGGPATKAKLGLPKEVVADRAGNLVLADSGNDRIRVVAAHTGTFYGQAMTAGHIYTIAGNGPCGDAGNGGPARQASFCAPDGVALDAAGNLLIADAGNNQVRVIASRTGTCYGQPMTAGDIYAVAGTGRYGFAGDGGPATAARLSVPESVTVDTLGDVLIADAGSARVRAVAAATGSFYGRRMTAGDIYTVAGYTVAGLGAPGPGDGGPAARAQLYFPHSVATDHVGNLVTADPDGDRIRVVAAATGSFYGQAMTAGDIYTVAGTGKDGFSTDGGPATKAPLSVPEGVAVDSAGNLVISEEGRPRVRVVAVSTGTFYGQAMTAGDIYTVAGTGRYGFTGDGGPATSTDLSNPAAAAIDADGNLLIGNSILVRVVAVSTGTFYGQAMTAGDIYTMAGHGTQGGYSGDGGPATEASLSSAVGVAVDHTGNVIISDAGGHRVRVVAARTGSFYGQQMTAGDIYTVTGDGTAGYTGDGGPATAAEISGPQNVAVDSAGNLLIADTGNSTIRVVAAHTGSFYGQDMTAGDIYTAAGNVIPGFTGDGGPAIRAELHHPYGVAAGPGGELLIADTFTGRIRSVTGWPRYPGKAPGHSAAGEDEFRDRCAPRGGAGSPIDEACREGGGRPDSAGVPGGGSGTA